MPDAFKDWVKDNAGRIAHAKSLPYFLRDNGRMEGGKYVLNQFGKGTDSRIEGNRKDIVKAGRNLVKWASGYLPEVKVGKFVAHRLVIESENLDKPAALTKTFFKETCSKHKSDPLYLTKLEYARQVTSLLKQSVYKGLEHSTSHPDAVFKVYECLKDGYRVQIKIKSNADADIVYIMRLFKQEK